MLVKQAVYEKLDSLGIAYEVVDHQAVHTMEDMFAAQLDKKGHLCKNLFVRDVKGNNHFLIVLSGEKQADLKK
ncbi:MAG: YbaK/EbsC family protein, partial [Oscillospiraceae bacterium]